jgi:hypothetical protein
LEKLSLTYTPAQREIFFNSPEKYIIIPKGRRLGLSYGISQAFIEYLLEGISPLLYVTTVNGNIDRYFDRYFLPVLKKLPTEIEWEWNKQKRELTLNGGKLDMRSADCPENLEGFSYRRIALDECGIILKNDYLYTNSILPMMLDYPDSQIFVAGCPKGTKKRNGSEHKFYQLYKQAKADTTGQYKVLQYSTFENPYISDDQIKALEKEFMMQGYNNYLQEIMGEFVEEIIGGNPFMYSYDPSKHESIQAVYNPHRQVLISIDFNLNPFTAIFAHMWKDQFGEHFHIFDEVEIAYGSIPEMVDTLWNKQTEYPGYLLNCLITGDAMGKRGDISQRDNASNYEQLRRGLRLREAQFKLPANPKQSNSRSECNYVLTHFPDFKINPDKCKGTCRDFKIVQADGFGQIIKSNRNLEEQRSDFMDNGRYCVNTFLKRWIHYDQKYNQRRLQ